MRDPRIVKLAQLLVHHSCQVQKGDQVLIEVFNAGHELARALVSEIYAAGGYPHVQLHDHTLTRALLLGTDEEHLKQWARFDLARMKEMDCYIGIRGSHNINETVDVPADKMRLQMELYNKPVHKEQRVNHTRWVVLRYPNASMAQLAQMSTEAFEDFYFDVCTLDYVKMDRAMDPLVERMERTDQVRIVGPGTDLTFSIKGLPAIKCAGRMNIPDGEVFTAPVRDSVNGVITFNTATTPRPSSPQRSILIPTARNSSACDPYLVHCRCATTKTSKPNLRQRRATLPECPVDVSAEAPTHPPWRHL